MAEATTQPQAQAAAPTTFDHSVPLKYADPRSLPSFPSSGLAPDGAAASAAATLGWHNQKSIELWKPDKLSSASAAAVLANDYKMAPQWEPTPAAAGQKAALLAVGSASSALKRQSSTPSPKGQHDGWGNSAATQAFHASRQQSTNGRDSALLSQGNSAATQAFNASRSQSARNTKQPTSPPSQADKSLMAAKGAMALGRPRASSTPTEPRDHETAAARSKRTASALNGASSAHRASVLGRPTAQGGGAVAVTTMTRNMFTSHPPVKPEIDEVNDAERLHQSAVEMARKMYNRQQEMIEQGKAASPDNPEKQQPTYLNLQDAAYKQAQERLAKLQDEHLKNRELQEYYGNTQAPPRRRFTVTNKLRRKTSDESFDDRRESEKIRQQMSMFSTKLSEVDKSKRQQDRDALMAAAQRNVRARLQGMDEKVYSDTGKVNPTTLSDWEIRAQQTARERHETRVENKGKVDVGGGMYMNPDDVNAIATKRMQPILDDINEKAEAERERQAALKLEEEAKKSELEREKEREREIKMLQRQARDEEKQDIKAKKQQAKEDARARKEEEKAAKTEQKRQAKEDRRRSKHDSATSGVVATDGLTDHETVPEHEAPVSTEISHELVEARREEAAEQLTEGRVTQPVEEPVKHHIAEESRVSRDLDDTAAPKTTTAAAVPAVATGAIESAETGESRFSESASGERRESTEESHKSKSKVKGWLQKHFTRRNSITEAGGELEGTERTEKSEKRRSLFGGKGLRRSHQNGSAGSIEQRDSSMRNLAMAGRDGTAVDEAVAPVNQPAQPGTIPKDSHGVSPMSSVEDLGRTSKQEGLAPPKPIGEAAPRASTNSRFKEEME